LVLVDLSDHVASMLSELAVTNGEMWHLQLVCGCHTTWSVITTSRFVVASAVSHGHSNRTEKSRPTGDGPTYIPKDGSCKSDDITIHGVVEMWKQLMDLQWRIYCRISKRRFLILQKFIS